MGVHRKDRSSRRIDAENNRGHIINLQNIVTVKNIVRSDKYQHLINLIHVGENHPRITDKLKWYTLAI